MQSSVFGTDSSKCAYRMNSHKCNIAHFSDTLTNVSDHFNSPGHYVQDFSFKHIDKVSNNWKLLVKKTTWVHVLGTISPKE